MASIGASLGPLDPPKTLIFLRFFNVFGIGPSSLQFRLTCPILRHHGPSWGHLGTLLGPLGAILGPSWASLGPPWALLGPPWCHHGAIVAHLGAIWGHLGPPWCPGPQSCWRAVLNRRPDRGLNARYILHFSHLGDILPHLFAYLAHIELSSAHLAST